MLKPFRRVPKMKGQVEGLGTSPAKTVVERKPFAAPIVSTSSTMNYSLKGLTHLSIRFELR